MNNYHILEEIGQGRGSVVYKGRKKQTIKYLAIKKVDKVDRDRVENEVKIMYTLEHPNVLKFDTWYETGKHIWLIIEYATGGDMLNLLRQDGKLPEDSIKKFAHDIVSGLHYVHHRGYIFGDLKPSNILMNEYGVLKLCDFGLSMPIPMHADEHNPRSKTGTPFYMAPELFHSQGVHSFASDLWALGCLLYEFATGQVPFFHKSVLKLVPAILNEEWQMVGEEFSYEFVDLLDQMLQKDPTQRITWEELLSHKWWEGLRAFPALDLPVQPLWSSRFGPNGTARFNEGTGFDGGENGTDNDNNNERAGSPRVSGEGSGESHTPKANKNITGVSVSMREIARMSMSAKQHLNGGNGPEDEDGRGAFSPRRSSRRDADVRLRDCDMELNFAEASSKPSTPKRPHEGRGDRDRERKEREDTADEEEDTGAIDTFAADKDEMRVSLTATLGHTANNGTLKEALATLQLKQEKEEKERQEITATRQQREREQKEREKASERNGRSLESQTHSEHRSSKHNNWAQRLLIHGSDTAVKPLVGNTKIEQLPAPRLTNEQVDCLTFKPLTVPALLSLEQSSLESFLTSVYKTLANNSKVSVGQRVAVLVYLQTIVVDTQVSNMIINCSLMTLFVKMLGVFKSSSIKVHLLRVMALLLRYATYIAKELGETMIVETLTSLLDDTHDTTRRRAACALGELLFYIATQTQAAASENDVETQASDKDKGWHCPNATLRLLHKTIQTRNEDSVVLHYVCKTVENVCAACSAHCNWFASEPLVLALFRVSQQTEHPYQLRLTALSATSLILWRSSHLISPFVDAVGSRVLAEGVDRGLTTGVRGAELSGLQGTVGARLRSQQCFVNLMNLSLYHTGFRTANTLFKEPAFIPGILKLLGYLTQPEPTPKADQLNDARRARFAKAARTAKLVVSAKAALCCGLLGQFEVGWLLQILTQSDDHDHAFLSVLDRLFPAQNLLPYAAKIVQLVRTLIPEWLRNSCQLIKNKLESALRDHSSQSDHTSVVLGIPPDTARNLKSLSDIFPLTLQCLSSTCFRQTFLNENPSLPNQLTEMLSLCRVGAHFPEVASVQESVLSVAEALAHYPSLLERDHDALELLRELFQLLTGDDDEESSNHNTCFLALKISSDIVQAKIKRKATKALETVLAECLLPHYPRLFREARPSPQYSLRLLSLIARDIPELADRLHSEQGLVRHLVDFFQPDHPNNGLHVAELLAAISRCPSSLPEIRNLGGSMACVVMLRYAAENALHDFYAPVLELLSGLVQSAAVRLEERDVELLLSLACATDQDAPSTWNVRFYACSVLCTLLQEESLVQQIWLERASLKQSFSALQKAADSNSSWALNFIQQLLKAFLLLCHSNKSAIAGLSALPGLRGVVTSLAKRGTARSVSSLAIELSKLLP